MLNFPNTALALFNLDSYGNKVYDVNVIKSILVRSLSERWRFWSGNEISNWRNKTTKKSKKIETEIWKQACHSLNYCKQRLISATSFTQYDSFSSSIYVFKVNKENTRKLCKACLKLKTAEQRQWLWKHE